MYISWESVSRLTHQQGRPMEEEVWFNLSFNFQIDQRNALIFFMAHTIKEACLNEKSAKHFEKITIEMEQSAWINT